MPREESLYPADWLRIAEADVRSSREQVLGLIETLRTQIAKDHNP